MLGSMSGGNSPSNPDLTCATAAPGVAAVRAAARNLALLAARRAGWSFSPFYLPGEKQHS